MKNLSILVLFFLLFSMNLQGQDTFSIVAVDPETGEVGSAGASCVDLNSFPGFSDDFLGELFPGLGAINTQAWYNQTNQINARNQMNAGSTPEEIIEWLVNNDVSGQPDLRQYGIAALVNGSPQTAAHTGSSTDDYKNHITGTHYSIQGNILLGQEVLDSMESRFLKAEGDLTCRLMAALQGANMIGADSRCTDNGTSSLFAFVKVAQPGDDFGSPSFVQSVRTSNGEGIEPIDALQTLFDQAQNCILLGTNEDLEKNQSVLVYPNPAVDIITIENINNEIYTLEILGATGKLMYKIDINEILEIDISAFPKGIYFIQLSNKSQVITKKIIKS